MFLAGWQSFYALGLLCTFIFVFLEPLFIQNVLELMICMP